MAVEIERKFLLKNDDWRHAVIRSEVMEQAYLGGTHCSVRVRISGDQAWLNIKRRVLGMARSEYEYPVPVADARAMIEELADGPVIAKTRHHVQVHGRHWEIDEFHGENAPLVVAEIELTHSDEHVDPPLWLGQEVTDQRRYYNSELAQKPYSRWDRPA